MMKYLLAAMFGMSFLVLLGAKGCGGGAGDTSLSQDAGTDTDTDVDTDTKAAKGLWECLICNGSEGK